MYELLGGDVSRPQLQEAAAATRFRAWEEDEAGRTTGHILRFYEADEMDRFCG